MQPTASAPREITIHSSVDRNHVTVGDPIRYTLTIESDAKCKVTPPDLGVNLGAFEIRDYHVHRSRTQRGQRWTVEFVIAIYDVGKFTIPPISVTYETNGKVNSIASQPVDITVESVKPSQQADIRDIKPPASVRLSVWDFRWLILAVLLLLALGIGVRVWLKRRKPKIEEQALIEKPPVPPDEEALAALQALVSSGLLESGQTKEYYSRLSQILRRYLERQFEIPALESSTSEVVQRLHLANLSTGESQCVSAILALSDLVKFAKFVPPVARGAEACEQIREIVLQSAARAEEVTSEPHAGGPGGDAEAKLAMTDMSPTEGVDATR